jgi:glycosyltransferase involved in cell wall biosynthesis
MRVTVGVKAFNEECHVGNALASALQAVRMVGGEVVLADSGSDDRTVQIAAEFPVKIVQLANARDRCCGAGAQLAFQQASSTYFYLMDGDMVLHPDFLPDAIDFLENNPDVAAVGGTVNERNVSNSEFQIRLRASRSERHRAVGFVDRLDGGGLYRVCAIHSVGHFADRNLHAFEEFDLAVRLRSAGWKLARIDKIAVDHFGYTMGGYKLLWRRMRSGYSWAGGEVLRGAIGRRHFHAVIRGLGHIRNGFVVIAWWVLVALCIILPVGGWFRLIALSVLLLGPIVFLSTRRGGLKLGIYSLCSWNVSALGLCTGLCRRRVPPSEPVAFKVLAANKPAAA